MNPSPSRDHHHKAATSRPSTKYKQIIRILKTSTSHGLSNMFRTERFVFRMFWIISFVLSVGLCIFYTVNKISSYMDCPVLTKVQYVSQDSVDFPAIAICNSNPFATNYSIDYLSSVMENKTGLKRQYSQSKIDFLNKNLGIKDLRLLFLAKVYNLDDQEKKLFGLKFKELVVKCEYNFMACRPHDFTWFYDFNYGNCYAFNYNRFINWLVTV